MSVTNLNSSPVIGGVSPKDNTPTSVIPDPIPSVPIDIAPLSRFRTTIKRLNTSKNVKQSPADLKIQNPYNQAATIFSLVLIPDATFKTKGIVEIYVDDDQLFICSAGDLTDVSTLSIPLPIQGKSLDNQKDIQVFIWTDGTNANLTVIAGIGVN